jgi:hypothetical protein
MAKTIVLDDNTAEMFEVSKELLKASTGKTPKDDSEMVGYLVFGFQECIQYQMKEAGLTSEVRRGGKEGVVPGIAS